MNAPMVTGRTAWFHCFAGIAGDMALGSLIDAGADFGELLRLLERLPIGGWSLDVRTVMRGGISATQALVGAKGSTVVRTYTHILGVLEEARLPDRVRDRAVASFSALAEVEGKLHRRPPAQVHFHEVGGHDTIIDIVGTAAALEILEVGTICASPVATGTGVVRTSHGILPNPAPAVVRLLSGAPLVGRDINVELTTPTGAAILAGMGSGFGPLPRMVVESTGFGAGSRELEELPNCTQVVVGAAMTPGGAADDSDGAQPLMLLETNIDDATGETLAHAVAALLEAGAQDAWLTPVVMKKGRPGYVLSVLSDLALGPALRAVLMAETGTLGVRSNPVDRLPVRRDQEQVDVAGLPVRVKVSPGRVKAEYVDASRVARRTGMPLREVISRAEEAWRQRVEQAVAVDAAGPPEDGGDGAEPPEAG